ncbi:MAG: hypothetical protein ACOH2A_14490 [Sphingobacteriaceae bacterium]
MNLKRKDFGVGAFAITITVFPGISTSFSKHLHQRKKYLIKHRKEEQLLIKNSKGASILDSGILLKYFTSLNDGLAKQ